MVRRERATAGTELEQRIAILEKENRTLRLERDEARRTARETGERMDELERAQLGRPRADSLVAGTLRGPDALSALLDEEEPGISFIEDDVEEVDLEDAADDVPHQDAFEKPRPFEAELEEYESFDDEENIITPSSSTAERRRELDRERADRELELGDEAFWLVCPKCGERLSEHEFDNVKVERCETCGVVCIDKGESELLLASDDERLTSYRVKGLLQ